MILQLDDACFAKSTNLSKAAFLAHKDAFQALGLNFDDFSHGLARASLVTQQAHAAIAREVSEESNQTAAAQDMVQEAYLKRADAIDAVGDAQDKVFGVKGALAAQQVGGAEAQAIADVRGPLTVRGAEIGIESANVQAAAAAIASRQAQGEKISPDEIKALRQSQAGVASDAAGYNQEQAELRLREAENNERERIASERAQGGPQAIVQRQLAEAFRAYAAAQRGEERAEMGEGAAERGTGAAERAQEALKLTQTGAVGEALMGRRDDINLPDVDRSVLTKALINIGSTEFGGGVLGTERALGDITKRFGLEPGTEGLTLGHNLAGGLYGRNFSGMTPYLEGLRGKSDQEIQDLFPKDLKEDDKRQFGEEPTQAAFAERARRFDLDSAAGRATRIAGAAAAPGVNETRGAETRIIRGATDEAAGQAADVSGVIGKFTSAIETGTEHIGGALKGLTDSLGGGESGGRGVREVGEFGLTAGAGVVGAAAGLSALKSGLGWLGGALGLGGTAGGAAGGAVATGAAVEGGIAAGGIAAGAVEGGVVGAAGGPIGVVGGAVVGAIATAVGAYLLSNSGGAPEAPKPAEPPAPKPEAPEAPQAPTTRTIEVESGGRSRQVVVPVEGEALQPQQPQQVVQPRPQPIVPVSASAAPAPAAPAPAAPVAASGAGELSGAAGALQSAAGALQGAAGALQGAAGAMHSSAPAPAPAAAPAPAPAQEQAMGGLIHGSGDDTSDSIPIMASPHEYIIKASSVRKIGTPILDRLNSGYALGGLIKGFADGGMFDSDDQKDRMFDPADQKGPGSGGRGDTEYQHAETPDLSDVDGGGGVPPQGINDDANWGNGVRPKGNDANWGNGVRPKGRRPRYAEGGAVGDDDPQDTKPIGFKWLWDLLGKVDVSGSYAVPPEMDVPTQTPSGQPTPHESQQADVGRRRQETEARDRKLQEELEPIRDILTALHAGIGTGEDRSKQAPPPPKPKMAHVTVERHETIGERSFKRPDASYNVPVESDADQQEIDRRETERGFTYDGGAVIDARDEADKRASLRKMFADAAHAEAMIKESGAAARDFNFSMKEEGVGKYEHTAAPSVPRAAPRPPVPSGEPFVDEETGRPGSKFDPIKEWRFGGRTIIGHFGKIPQGYRGQEWESLETSRLLEEESTGQGTTESPRPRRDQGVTESPRPRRDQDATESPQPRRRRHDDSDENMWNPNRTLAMGGLIPALVYNGQ